MLHAGATLLGGLAGLLLVAAGCTVGDRQPGPAPARPATSPTLADPIGVLRRRLRLPVLEPRAPCPVARAQQVDPAFALRQGARGRTGLPDRQRRVMA
jgi:hypothetical protein